MKNLLIRIISPINSSSDEELMVMTKEVPMVVLARRRTRHLHGLISKRDILILIDYGENYLFVMLEICPIGNHVMMIFPYVFMNHLYYP